MTILPYSVLLLSLRVIVMTLSYIRLTCSKLSDLFRILVLLTVTFKLRWGQSIPPRPQEYTQGALPPGTPASCGGCGSLALCPLEGYAFQTRCISGTAPPSPNSSGLRPQNTAVASRLEYNVSCFNIRR